MDRPLRGNILLAVANETFHTNPKRERGNDLAISLTLRVSVVFAREQYRVAAGRRASGARATIAGRVRPTARPWRPPAATSGTAHRPPRA